MDSVNYSDMELSREIALGNREAFSAYIEQYKRLVSHIVFRMVDNNADREDLCQDIFLKAYKNCGNFQGRSKMSTWLGSIAYNTCINYLKKMKTPLFDDMTSEDVSSDDYLIDLNTPERDAEKRDLKDYTEKLLECLPAQQRLIITLYHNDDLNYREIGELMELPEGTVKSYLFRARAKLKKRLDSVNEKEEILK